MTFPLRSQADSVAAVGSEGLFQINGLWRQNSGMVVMPIYFRFFFFYNTVKQYFSLSVMRFK